MGREPEVVINRHKNTEDEGGGKGTMEKLMGSMAPSSPTPPTEQQLGGFKQHKKPKLEERDDDNDIWR